MKSRFITPMNVNTDDTDRQSAKVKSNTTQYIIMSEITTTIIVPVYNGSRFLDSLLESITKQSVDYWECICVNDGSTDNSLKILESYAESDRRFKIINQKNSGCGVARGTALENVKTPYLMFADQDDILHPQAIEIATNAIKNRDIDVLLFGFEQFKNIPVIKPITVEPKVLKTSRNGLKLITGKRNTWPILVWRHIFKTTSVRGIPFPPITGGEDQAWMSELSWNNLSWASIEHILYFNRTNTSSQSRSTSKQYIKNVLFSYEWMQQRAKIYKINPADIKRFTHRMKIMFILSIIFRRIINMVIRV